MSHCLPAYLDACACSALDRLKHFRGDGGKPRYLFYGESQKIADLVVNGTVSLMVGPAYG